MKFFFVGTTDQIFARPCNQSFAAGSMFSSIICAIRLVKSGTEGGISNTTSVISSGGGVPIALPIYTI
jgi:hypothetical protein